MAPADRSPSSGPPPVRAVGGVHLLRRVGDGAMSEVFLGYDAVRGRHVAVKLLADHLATDPGAVRRFRREGVMSRQLSHPNLVSGLNYGTDAASGKHFLVLEFVDGPSALTRLGRAGPLPVPALARVAADVGAALRHLHTRSLIHRDVKPDNILLAPDGSAKLADLGLARRLPGGRADVTPPAAGTPHYMPPEQVIDCDRADPRSDLYALGVTLYHLATGRVPFDGASQDELLGQKLGGRFPLAGGVRPDLPAGADHLFARLLAADPADRFQTAGEFLLAATEHLGPPEPLRPAGAPDLLDPLPGADTDPGGTHVAGPVVPPADPPGRAAAGLLLLAAAVAAGLAARWGPPEPDNLQPPQNCCPPACTMPAPQPY